MTKHFETPPSQAKVQKSGDQIGNVAQLAANVKEEGFEAPETPTVVRPKSKNYTVGPYGVQGLRLPGSKPLSLGGGKTTRANQIVIDMNTTPTDTASGAPAPAPQLRELAVVKNMGIKSFFSEELTVSKNRQGRIDLGFDIFSKFALHEFFLGRAPGFQRIEHGLPVLPLGESEFIPAPRAFAYGYMNATPLYPYNIFRRDRYGQFADMMYQSPESVFVVETKAVDRDRPQLRLNPLPSMLGTPEVFTELNFYEEEELLKPVVAHSFYRNRPGPGGDPGIFSVFTAPSRYPDGTPDAAELTNTQNLDMHATSSLPFIDGLAFDRFTKQPDEREDNDIRADAEGVIVDGPAGEF